jgi:hypothetical protein
MTKNEKNIDPRTLAINYDRTISYQRIFTVFGGIKTALFLSQACYWSYKKYEIGEDGWFYKTSKDWEFETDLTFHDQKSIRNKLIKLGILSEKRLGINATKHFKVNFERLEELKINAVEGYLSKIQSNYSKPPEVLPPTEDELIQRRLNKEACLKCSILLSEDSFTPIQKNLTLVHTQNTTQTTYTESSASTPESPLKTDETPKTGLTAEPNKPEVVTQPIPSREKEIAAVIDSFRVSGLLFKPNFGNKTERKAAAVLLDQFPLSQIESMVKYYAEELKRDPFLPQADRPSAFLNKLGLIKAKILAKKGISSANAKPLCVKIF